MNIELFQQENLEKLPLFDLPVDFVVYDKIDGNLLKFYRGYPCKIDACIFAYLMKGNAKAQVNLWDFDIHEHDLVAIIPGSFIEINEVSDDIKVAIVGFSSSFLKTANQWNILLPMFNKPVMCPNDDLASIYSEMFACLSHAASFNFPVLSNSVMIEVLKGLLLAFNDNLKTGILTSRNTADTSSHESKIASEFLQLAFENYREEHKISFYAHQINLTLSHFCSVINRALGKTPQEIIKNMIIMDAQTQLKGSDSSVTSIATSLGFPTATAFNRYFRTYTGMTPLDYRNS